MGARRMIEKYVTEILMYCLEAKWDFKSQEKRKDFQTGQPFYNKKPVLGSGCSLSKQSGSGSE